MALEVGAIVDGVITGITNFGVFVDIGDNKTGMVHISELSSTFVNQITDFVKEGDKVKAKVLAISAEGKISLSMKQAEEGYKDGNDKKNFRKPSRQTRKEPPKPDPSYVWTAKKSESDSFEDMMNKFKQTSEDKFSDLKRKNVETRRPRRGSGYF